MAAKSSNKKFVLGVVFAVLAILLAYAFTVIYFFYISPNDISMRLKIFPLLSDSAVATQYTDAIVELNFTAKEGVLEEEKDVAVFGVNFREDGYVLASYYDFDYYEIGTITAISSGGGVYNAQIIFSDETLNLTLVKLTNSTGKEVSLPYVNLYTSEIGEDIEIITVEVGYETVGTSEIKYTNVETGYTYGISGAVFWTKDVGDWDFIQYFNDDCLLYYASGYPSDESPYGAFVFDKNANLLGLCGFCTTDEIGFATTASNITIVLDDVISNYEESQEAYSLEIISAFKGLSAEELFYHSEMNNTNTDRVKLFYYSDSEYEFTDSITSLLDTTVQDYENYSFKWFYLVEDFVYGDATISADSVLTEISVNGTTTTITSHFEFVKLLYGLKTGDEVSLYYYSDFANYDEGTTEIESVTFTI